METKRIVNEGAEKHLYVEKPVLNKGHLTLIDYMGTDASIIGAARVSYAKDVDQTEVERNQKLITYLMKNRHTSPFEQAVLTFKLKVPMFIGEQILRHRTARPNKQSGRYTEFEDEWYVPPMSRIKAQDKVNKQGSSGELPDQVKERFLGDSQAQTLRAFDLYHQHVDENVSKELARINLPASTFATMVWQIDLHNLLHFLRLRLDGHAQWEVQEYAKRMAEIVKESFPMTWAAFEEHVLYALTFSKSEVEALRYLLDGKTVARKQLDPAFKKLGIDPPHANTFPAFPEYEVL